MIAQRHNITVIIQDGKERKYFNVMLQNEELKKLVGQRVYEILVYCEGVWVDDKGNLQ